MPRGFAHWTLVLGIAAVASDCANNAEIVDALSITPAQPTIGVDQLITLGVTATANGQPVPQPTLTWWSSDTSVATVNPNGIVHGVHPGTVRIDASTTGVVGSTTVIVKTVNPLPEIFTLSRDVAGINSFGFNIDLTGRNFTPESTIRWNDAPVRTFFRDAQYIYAEVGSALTMVVGTAAVTVVTPAPGGGTSSVWYVTMVPHVAVTQLAPASANAGSGGFTLTINGVYFQPGATLTWGGTTRPTTFVSPQQVTVQLTAADVAVRGSVLCSVTNPDGSASLCMFQVN